MSAGLPSKRQALAKVASFAAAHLDAMSLEEICDQISLDCEALTAAEEARLGWAVSEVTRRLRALAPEGR